jgi:hypothetical protein
MLSKELFEPIIMDDCPKCRGVAYRDNNGSVTYLSFFDNRRYGAGKLGFSGSEEEFIEALKRCPPDLGESFVTLSPERMWSPTYEQKIKEKEFREDISRKSVHIGRNAE